MASTYRARHVLKIGDAVRLPDQLVPEAALWDRLQSAITTGYVRPVDVTDEDFIAAVLEFCPDQADQLAELYNLEIEVPADHEFEAQDIETGEEPYDVEALPEPDDSPDVDRDAPAGDAPVTIVEGGTTPPTGKAQPTDAQAEQQAVPPTEEEQGVVADEAPLLQANAGQTPARPEDLPAESVLVPEGQQPPEDVEGEQLTPAPVGVPPTAVEQDPTEPVNPAGLAMPDVDAAIDDPGVDTPPDTESGTPEPEQVPEPADPGTPTPDPADTWTDTPPDTPDAPNTPLDAGPPPTEVEQDASATDPVQDAAPVENPPAE